MSQDTLTEAERAALHARFRARMHVLPQRRDRVRRARHWLAWRVLDVTGVLLRLASWLQQDGRRR